MPGNPLERTKVVVRKLPPLMSEAELLEELDSVAANQYDWLSFVPGKVRCEIISFGSCEALKGAKTEVF